MPAVGKGWRERRAELAATETDTGDSPSPVAPDDPVSVSPTACPTCGADGDTPCRTKAGAITKDHARRQPWQSS